jgi:UDP-N-acetylmuramoylalanine--D-glutamate ligase
LLDQMHFNVGLILNVTPDHLDRHNTMEEYIAAKRHIFNHQSKSDVAIIGADDEYCKTLIEDLIKLNKQKVIPISSQCKVKGGVAVLNNIIYDDTGVTTKEIAIGALQHLKGEHNAQNIAAAYAAVRHYKVSDEVIVKAIHSFVGLDHRMQYIGNIDKVAFYNDSKATNADATAKALTVSKHIYWIIGGQAKAGGISSLENYFSGIAHAYIIGAAQEEFAATLEGKVPYTKIGTLDKAVEAATQAACESGYEDAVVLLSPACASFDQYANFMVRGEKFCQLVQEQKKKYA